MVDRVVGELAVECRVDGVLVVAEQQRVAVRLGRGGDLARHHARGAGPVVDNHGLLEGVGELGREHPGENVRGASLGGGRQQADRAVGVVVLGVGWGGQRGQGGEEEGGGFHGGNPSAIGERICLAIPAWVSENMYSLYIINA